jgi:hypothetical protein
VDWVDNLHIISFGQVVKAVAECSTMGVKTDPIYLFYPSIVSAQPKSDIQSLETATITSFYFGRRPASVTKTERNRQV